jgi:hypothetical protein
MLTPKNWYRKKLTCGPKLAGEYHSTGVAFNAFGKKRLRSGVYHHSAKVVPRLKAETFGNAWWCGLNIKKETSWWWIRNRHDAMLWVLGNKYCNHSRLGVVLGTGYKYKPLVFVIGIEQFHNKPASCQLSSPSSRAVEFFERSHRSVDLRKYRQPCIMSSIMRWI